LRANRATIIAMRTGAFTTDGSTARVCSHSVAGWSAGPYGGSSTATVAPMSAANLIKEDSSTV
jgi:hypothetical protein